MEIGGGVVVRRLGWMIAQLAVWAGMSYLLLWGTGGPPPTAEDQAGVIFLCFFLTIVVFGFINLIHNWLLRCRASKAFLQSGVGLADEPDHNPDGLRRIGAGTEDTLKIPEIPLREKPRKLLRPPS